MFLAKFRSKMEVINEINGDLITFYRGAGMIAAQGKGGGGGNRTRE